MNSSEKTGSRFTSARSSFFYLEIIILVFIVGIFLSFLYWHNIEKSTENANIIKYQQRLEASKSIIVNGLDQYALLLDDGTSLLSADNYTTTQAEWLAFFQSYGLTTNYPGVDAVSFSRYVNNGGSISAPVTFIGYISPASLTVMGHDQMTNPIEAAAITRSIDTGNISMSAKLRLSTINNDQASFFIYKPIFNGPSQTLAQRQSSVYGFVYAAISSNALFDRLLGEYLNSNLAVEAYDSTINPNNLLYQSPKYTTVIQQMHSPIFSTLNVDFGGRNIALRIATSSKLIYQNNGASDNSLFIGIAVSLVASVFVWYFTFYRERKLYWEKQVEVQSAKDELLSLASHQLRTPATIVKQYLGILLQNYAGEITPQQMKIIQTAYDSNEHQLEIANRFLSAARIGSGQITLSKEELSLPDLVEKVVLEQKKIAGKRRQKIVFKKPKRELIIEGDSKYLPMVFENLINNAIKYSKRQSTIDVKLQRVGPNAVFSVKDQGIGIASDELPDIFDKFTRASNAQQRQEIGTGVGLYLAKHVTDLHNGSISASSTIGKGTEFTVNLPLRKKD